MMLFLYFVPLVHAITLQCEPIRVNSTLAHLGGGDFIAARLIDLIHGSLDMELQLLDIFDEVGFERTLGITEEDLDEKWLHQAPYTVDSSSTWCHTKDVEIHGSSKRLGLNEFEWSVRQFLSWNIIVSSILSLLCAHQWRTMRDYKLWTYLMSFALLQPVSQALRYFTIGSKLYTFAAWLASLSFYFPWWLVYTYTRKPMRQPFIGLTYLTIATMNGIMFSHSTLLFQWILWVLLEKLEVLQPPSLKVVNHSMWYEVLPKFTRNSVKWLVFITIIFDISSVLTSVAEDKVILGLPSEQLVISHWLDVRLTFLETGMGITHVFLGELIPNMVTLITAIIVLP